MDAISSHYQIPIVWLEVETIQNQHLFQNTNILKVHVSNSSKYNESKPAFAVIAINVISTEFYSVRPVIPKIKLLLSAVHKNKIPATSDIQTVLEWLQTSTYDNLNQTQPQLSQINQPTGIDTNTPLKPRFTKVLYPHIQKSFYQKNAITRFILCSRDTNKLTRPTNTQMQSQDDIIHNLGSSELFSNYDLTAAYDAVPACPISSLINTASYRQKEYALLIASMGGSNSVLYCQRAVNSLMHRVNDQLLLQPCYLPHPISNINPRLENEVE